MAFTLQAVVGTTTYNLSDGSPYSLEGASGLGMPPVLRYEQTSPLQHGATDLGYNLTPRVITLSLNFAAATDAILDGYRDDLNDIFRPSTGQAVKLRVTRDDGGVRQIDTYATANDIQLVTVDRPGHLHRAVVQLRAANPVWYNPTPGTVSMQLPTTDWWLGVDAIGSADVLEHVGTPTLDQTWTWAGTEDAVTVLWRMAGSIPSTKAGAVHRYAWSTGAVAGTVLGFAARGSADIYDYSIFQGDGFHGYSPLDPTRTYLRFYAGTVYTAFLAGTIFSPYFVPIERQELGYHDKNRSYGPIARWQWNTGIPHIIGGGRWGGRNAGTAQQWPGTITHAAIYSGSIPAASIRSVAYAIDSGTLNNREVALGYAGDTYEYPVITVAGPVTNPIITNVTTGDKLDFTGSTVPAGVTYTIDLRADTLSVTDSGGTVRTSQLTSDSMLGTWAIAPSPIAYGGTNVITLTGTAIGTATAVNVVYYNRYLSY